MAGARKSSGRSGKADEHETGSTLIGQAYTMPEHALEAMSLVEQTPIDFQARQDSIAETRRGPDGKLAPKLKRTSVKPARARETDFKP